MKRCFVVMLSVVAIMLSVLEAVAEVPNVITYQGRLTTASDDVVPDGSYSMTFIIWDSPTAGAAVWNSGAQTVAVTAGFFTVNLGAAPMPAIPPAIWWDSSRYLGVTVGTDPEMAPRTRLTSGYASYLATFSTYSYHSDVGEYARRADTASVALSAPEYFSLNGGTISGEAVHDAVDSRWQTGGMDRLRMIPGSFQLSVYGSDNLEDVRLGSASGASGQLSLYDGQPANVNTVLLTATQSSGGVLHLRTAAGGTGIVMQGGVTGNSSVQLPLDAISASECLDEPGVANTVNTSSMDFNAGNIDYTVDSVEILIPGPGYVEVSASSFLYLWSSSTTVARIVLSISKTRANADETYPGSVMVTGPLQTSGYVGNFPYYVSRLYYESSVGSRKYFLNAEYRSGTSSINGISRPVLRAKYYPTAYGTVELTSEALTDGSEVDSPAEAPGPAVVTQSANSPAPGASIATELAAIWRLQAELQARIRALEESRGRTPNQ